MPGFVGSGRTEDGSAIGFDVGEGGTGVTVLNRGATGGGCLGKVFGAALKGTDVEVVGA